MKCLQVDAKKRYQTAEALTVDLERWLAGYAILPERLPKKLWRMVRRHLVASAVILGIALLAGIVAAVNYFNDPQRVLEAYQATLDRGGEIWLIPATGAPRWRRWILPGSIGTPRIENNFLIHSGDHSLLELYAGKLPKMFQLSAEIRQEAHVGNCGLFFGYREFDLAEGGLHTFIRLEFSNFGPNGAQGPDKGHVGLELVHLYRPTRGLGFFHSSQLGPKAFKRFASDSSRWRQIVLQVREGQIRVRWDGQPLATVTEAQRLDGARRMLFGRPQVQGITADFSPYSSLGLYLEKGTASYRNVALQRLED